MVPVLNNKQYKNKKNKKPNLTKDSKQVFFFLGFYWFLKREKSFFPSLNYML